jgi:glycosyltransferase involved in cell wall biosynthesis
MANPMPPPFISICIPQYSRFPFLLRQLEILNQQEFRDFEICISDDKSPEKGAETIKQFLSKSGIPFRYEVNPINLRYDGNLRSAIQMAQGTYVLLMGNDDALHDEKSLGRIAYFLKKYPTAGALLTNYRSVANGTVFRRVKTSGPIGRGLSTALQTFRHYSFVSGVVLDRAKSQDLATDRWDGAEQYQMYLASRIVSQGSELIGIDEVLIQCGLQIDGNSVDSYAKRSRPKWSQGIPKLSIPLAQEAGLVFDAVQPAVGGKIKKTAWAIQKQIYQFTYGYWLFEYRRTLGWPYMAGFIRALNPSRTESYLPKEARNPSKAWFLFLLITFAGVLVPQLIFEKTKPFFYQLAKRTNR